MAVISAGKDRGSPLCAYARIKVNKSAYALVQQPEVIALDPRTRALLDAPIGRTIVRLALPNIVVMLVQTSIGLIETYFVAKLGVDALAAMALVFPPFMLLTMVSAGA